MLSRRLVWFLSASLVDFDGELDGEADEASRPNGSFECDGWLWLPVGLWVEDRCRRFSADSD